MFGMKLIEMPISKRLNVRGYSGGLIILEIANFEYSTSNSQIAVKIELVTNIITRLKNMQGLQCLGVAMINKLIMGKTWNYYL